jgi:hypothetical protein
VINDPAMPTVRAHAILSALFVASRLLLGLLGLRFSFSVDWMFLADPLDLRDHLFETLLYFHAFPPGINALTGVLLKFGESAAPSVAHALFFGLGVVLVNVLCYLGRSVGLSMRAAATFALLFSLTPAAIYFEHLYHYEWVVITMLTGAAALFHRAVRTPSVAVWSAFFAVCALIGLMRSTFHLIWYVAMVALAVWFGARGTKRRIVAAAVVPALLLAAVYAKNLVLFGDFGVSTFGPAGLTLLTVHRMPQQLRAEWIREGRLSPYAAISVYAPPREYARFFATPEHEGWPHQVTRLEHRGVQAPNFNHWWVLDVHRARRSDILYFLRQRPLDYLANVREGVRDFFSPSTTWHPRDGTPVSPHYQHRQVLGPYERVFNRIFHSAPIAPVGVYVFLPLVLVWSCVRAWSFGSDNNASARARGALLLFCVLQIVYVVAASNLLTLFESSRYRFQVEWAIWLLACELGAVAWRRMARRLLDDSFNVLRGRRANA